ncbi:UDP-N-acetylmuramoyl-L-alanine--D-glutamate ligase [Veronia nyctiphanis]|uniref:UDP-N-acetylmuramoylalanine--D-glutamate ligase n=1 Tax=Veronia nyctiphanis TaxID=1278244 RepID=A0A4Q0YTK3_9GAMM|nr:UDP-N-acetylmuramoyl-L-alanine--D-glutamate ligase [Veronia nyctiphanis]RXJ72479.1 UDP-N-acetylmuramoyl-L-alanine--D-glutamate ligase [Veronia nyctiphanis]
MTDGLTAKNIVVIGLGMTGLSVVQHLQSQNAACNIKVIDTRDEPPGAEALSNDIQLHVGGWSMEWLLSADLIVASPGIALASPELKQAADNNIEIIGDIELFARAVTAPVVAITGSNGKSTVTSLVGEMAKQGGMDVGVGGNIGHAALDMLAEDHELYVLELSSFQLETTSSLDLAAAAFLNLSEDHMDRYEGMDDYKAAKLRIFDQSRLAVWNDDDRETKLANGHKNVRFGFSKGEYSLTIVNQDEWLSVNGEALLPVSDIALVGRHNVANCLAAMALADAVNISRDAQLKAIKQYAGLPHRCQTVLNADGVRWVNDSKATNLASTLAALDGLEIDGTLHLLLGGDGKGADFSALSPVINKLNASIYCFGKDREQLAALSSESIQTDTMAEAMALAYGQVNAGDMVLLSPACASLDQFKNFMVRGETFCRVANELNDRKKVSV